MIFIAINDALMKVIIVLTSGTVNMVEKMSVVLYLDGLRYHVHGGS